MMPAPWNPVEGWDVPRGFWGTDPPDPNEDSFCEMVEERLDMPPKAFDTGTLGYRMTIEQQQKEIERLQSIISSLLFWMHQGKFDALPMAAIRDMVAAKRIAEAAARPIR